MSANNGTPSAARADAIIDRAFSAAFDEAIKARAADDATIGDATKEFIAAWRRVADDRAARSGSGVDLGRRLSALQARIANAAALAGATGLAADGAGFGPGPVADSCGGISEACYGIAGLLDSLWNEVGNIHEDLDAQE